MPKETSHIAKPHSWVYNLRDRKFLYWQGSPESNFTEDPVKFEIATGISRLSVKFGHVFSILGAPKEASQSATILHTRGIVLSEDPLILSGVSQELEPKEIGYLFEPNKSQVQQLLRDWSDGTARSAVHALKAPINRIKGIATILKEELSDPSQIELTEYLSSSGSKLSNLANYLLEVAKDHESEPPISVNEFITQFSSSLSQFTVHPPAIHAPDWNAEISASEAFQLERLLINIATYETEEGMAKLIHFEKSDDNVLSISIEHHLAKEGVAVDLLQFQSEDIPEGSVEMIQQSPHSLVIRNREGDNLIHRIVFPILDSE